MMLTKRILLRFEKSTGYPMPVDRHLPSMVVGLCRMLWFFFCLPLFCQEVITEHLSLNNGKIALPGVLTCPSSKAPLPLAVFIHGSGPVDRDGNIPPTVKPNYVAQLRSQLNDRGIAFYSYDKRTAVPANISLLKEARLADFVADVRKAVSHFKKDPRFSGIHLIGHSQGALVAVLALDEDIRSVCSLAGSGQNIAQVITAQIKRQDSTLGAKTMAHFDELQKTDTILKPHPFLYSLFAPQNQGFVRDWMQYDPMTHYKKSTRPMLIIHAPKTGSWASNMQRRYPGPDQTPNWSSFQI